MMADDVDNVIQLDTTRVPAFECKPRKRGCYHQYFILDNEKREVTCRKCGVVVDAFDALVTVSLDWTQYVSNQKMCREESDKAAARLEELKRQERNARARLKRLEQKGGG